ncbi:hypothetical protein NQ314_019501, partial [Rhamnusium bicolor]
LGGTNGQSSSGGGLNGLTNILSTIDLPGLLRGVNSFVKLVGAFCPPLSQSIWKRNFTKWRTWRGSGGGGQTVSVVLPTFPPDEDDDDDDDFEDDSNNESNSSPLSTFNAELLSRSSDPLNNSSTEPLKNSDALVLSVEASSSISDSSDSDVETTTSNIEESDSNSGTTLKIDNIEEAANPTTLYTSPANEESNLIAKRHVRVTREAEDDQEGAESAPQPADDLSNVSIDDQDRNKRFLPFGGSVEGHASGGSGNFLFDIIRVSNGA